MPSDIVPADVMVDIVALLPVAIVDDTGRIRHWSPGCAAMYGWSAAEAVGTVRYELLQSSLTTGAAPLPVERDGPARSLEETHRDGHRIHVLEQVMPLPRPGWQAFVMMRRDSGADDSIRVALARRLNAIGVFTYDVHAQRLEWSQQRWRPLGVETGTMSLEQLKNNGLGSASERVIALCREAMRNGSEDIEIELPIQGRMLGIRNLRARGRLVRDRTGAVERFVGVMQDITDADIRECALRDRQAELRGILDSVSDAMVVIDRNGIIGSFSRAAQELLGYPGVTMIERPIAPLIEGGWPAIRAAVVQGGPREMSAIHASGDRLPVELRVGSLSGDMASRHILFFSDISERKAQEARRTRFEHTARDIAMAEYAVHLMHELNQPLAAASNFLAVARHLAKDPAQVADAGAMIDMALGQIQRLGGVIRNTQRKAIGEEIAPKLVLVRAAVDEAVALVQVAHGVGGVAIEIAVDPDAMTMFVDPIGIQQVLANLLRNAIEAFGPAPCPGARIQVRSQRTARRLLLSVSDNGPGIPAAMLGELFEPFRQRDKKGGMGLGLSICRTIAEAHGGTLTAENLPGQGARFTLGLPLSGRGELA